LCRTIPFVYGDRGIGAGSAGGAGRRSHNESCSRCREINLPQVFKSPVEVEHGNLSELLGGQVGHGAIAVDGVTAGLDKPLHEHGQLLLDLSKDLRRTNRRE
jgi:hypothetical protein